MTGKTNAVIEMNLEKPQVSRTTRSGPALPEIRRRRIDDKVIWPNKANSSASSRNQDRSIRYNYFRKKENGRILQNKTSMSARSSPPSMKMCATPLLLPGPRRHKVILPNKANFSANCRNKDTSLQCDYPFS